MDTYKVIVPKLNKRTAPVHNTGDKSTVAGIVTDGFTFISYGHTVNEIGVWYRDKDNFWYWGKGVQKVTSPTSSEPPEPLAIPNWWITDYGIDAIWKQTKGAGVKVAVIDTGLDYNHSNIISKKNIEYYNVITGSDKKEDCFAEGSHGTMCAGMIAGQGPDVYGVAPKADLLVIKATRSGDLDFSNDLINAINKAVELKSDIISISYDRQFKTDDPAFIALSDTITKATKNNILIIASAGNANSSKKRYPAAIENCLSVGAVSQQQTLSNFTLNHETDILAPGENITLLDNNNTIRTDSGTSFATPFVAGVCALYFSKYGKNIPSFINALKSSAANKETIADAVNQKYTINIPGLGIINPQKMFELI